MRSQTVNYWPRLISLLTCYHYGYHREHHAMPHVPWWQLPQVTFQTRGQSYLSERLSGHVSEPVSERLPAHIERVNHKCASSGSALATMSRPLVRRNRTRLKT